MHIQQFESSISKTYITRGKKYYRDGHVFALTQMSPTMWRAEVEGTEDYFVFVELVGECITMSVCNCPVDGPYCKHEVAVYYEMREVLKKRKPHYEQEVVLLVSNYLQQKAQRLNSRPHYRELARELVSYAQAGYTEQALALKELLMKLYAKKRALLEELRIVES